MMQVTDPPSIPSPVFAVTVSGTFLVALDLSIVNVAFPSIRRRSPRPRRRRCRGCCPPTASCSAPSCSAPAASPTGPAAGGGSSGLVVFRLGSLLCGLAPSAGLLIGGRVVQAVGAALLMPASLALLLVATPPPLRARAVATWGGISALAVALGPSLGSVLIDAGGWRWAFLVNLPVVLVAILVTRRVVTESMVGGPPPDLLGVAPALSVAAARPGHHLGRRWGWTSALVLGAFAASRCSACRPGDGPRHPAPAIDLALFRSRTAALANAATVAYAVGFFAMLLGNVLFLTTVWGYSTLQAGLAITPGPLVVAVLAARRAPGGAGGLPAGAGGRRPGLRQASVLRHRHAARPPTTWAAGCPPAWSRASASPSPSPCSARPPWPDFRRPLRRGRRPQPDGPAVGRRAGRRPAGLDPRDADVTSGGARRLPERVAHERGAALVAALISSRQRRVVVVTPEP